MRTPLANDDGYAIDTDHARLDLDLIHRYLSEESYWARGVARDRIARAVANSYCFGVYAPDGAQIGFARVVTDYARQAGLFDVFILPAHRGRGLAKWLMETMLGDPALEGVIWRLSTLDAHALYARYGFRLSEPGRQMERDPNAPK
jgi:GNAT superfamily N-acetyltransferase